MTLAEQIEELILNHARNTLDEHAITESPSRHKLIDTSYLPDDLDVTDLSKLLATALTAPLSTKRD